MNTLTMPPLRATRVWRGPALAYLAYVILLLLAYRETATTMVGIWWRSETFAHAFVVPPIVLWLVWRKRAELARIEPVPVPWLALALALLAGLWWLGDLVSVNAVTQLALTAMLVAGVPVLLGWQVARTLMFPLAFLFFAVPIGEFMTPVLMHYTADFTVFALRLTGIPIYREGQQFVIPSGTWSVIDECSGIRYLMASFMVGTLFAYLNYRRLRRRLVFMGFSIVVPIVANWLRAYLIVMLAHLSGNKLATGVDHILYGWVFFGIVIMAMFFIGARWAEPDLPSAPQQPQATGGSASGQWSKLWLTLGAAVIAVGFVQLPRLQPQVQGASAKAPVMQLPDRLAAGWSADPREISSWRPIFVEPALEIQRTYSAAAGRIGVHVAYYRNESETSKLVSSVNVLVPMRHSEWNQLATGSISSPSPAGSIAWRTADLGSNVGAVNPERQQLRVWRVYWIGDRLVAGDTYAKLLQLWQRLRREPDDGAEIMLIAASASKDDADRLLGEFASANLDALKQVLAAAARVR